MAGFEAYIALTLSSIIDTIPLRPENFLVIDDYTSVFKDKVIATRVGDDGWLASKPEEVEVENSIWDGQSLIDRDAMGSYSGYGMILLRNRFSSQPASTATFKVSLRIVVLQMCPSWVDLRWQSQSVISRLLRHPAASNM